MTSHANHPDDEPVNAHDLLAAWALDAVDDHERSVVERAIAADPELALEARGLRETTALLAGSAAAAHRPRCVPTSWRSSPRRRPGRASPTRRRRSRPTRSRTRTPTRRS